jgi:hypothetical protein
VTPIEITGWNCRLYASKPISSANLRWRFAEVISLVVSFIVRFRKNFNAILEIFSASSACLLRTLVSSRMQKILRGLFFSQGLKFFGNAPIGVAVCAVDHRGICCVNVSAGHDDPVFAACFA